MKKENSDVADKPSTGARRHKSDRPWIIEYRYPVYKGPNLWLYHDHDGEWHRYFKRYLTEEAAQQAAKKIVRDKEFWCKWFTERQRGEWRVSYDGKT
jgi:hypothetical protein